MEGKEIKNERKYRYEYFRRAESNFQSDIPDGSGNLNATVFFLLSSHTE